MAIVGIIPSRHGSTRLPGKPLLSDTGRPLIQHVVEAARQANRLERIIVATDDLRIARAVEAFGGEVVMTREDHPTGTDRVAEVVARMPEATLIVNLQGDEPEISGEAIDLLVALLEADPGAPMATLATPIREAAIYHDPSCVKVVMSATGRALYFSRSPIPYHRDGSPDFPANPPAALLHLGLYAYRREFLLNLATIPPSPSKRPKSSNNSASSKPATPSPSGSSKSEESASTPPKTTAASSSGGGPAIGNSGHGSSVYRAAFKLIK